MQKLLFSIIPYLLIVIILLIPLLSNARKRHDKYFFFSIMVVMAFSAFRYGVGWDYFNYCNAIMADDWQVERMEPIMRWLARFSYKINYPHFFIMITSIATISLYSVVIFKKSFNPMTSLLVFLCLPFLFLSSINVVRFSLAVAVVFFASLYHNKPFIYISLIVVAFLIHRAGILGMLVWPFLGIIKIGRLGNWIIFILGLMASFMPSFMAIVFSGIVNTFSNIGFLDESVSSANRYLEEVSGMGFTRLPYLYAIINAFNLIQYKELCRNNPGSKVSTFVTLYNVGTSFMLFLSFDAVFSSRLGQLFMVFIVLLIPYYLTLKSRVHYIGVIAFVVVLFFVQISIRGFHPDFVGRWNCYLPYETIFSKGNLM